MSVESICGIVRKKKIPSGFKPGSTCKTIDAAILTAWPTVKRCGRLWGTYTVATILPIPSKKKKRLFVLVLTAFFTLAKIFPLF